MIHGLRESDVKILVPCINPIPDHKVIPVSTRTVVGGVLLSIRRYSKRYGRILFTNSSRQLLAPF